MYWLNNLRTSCKDGTRSSINQTYNKFYLEVMIFENISQHFHFGMIVQLQRRYIPKIVT